MRDPVHPAAGLCLGTNSIMCDALTFGVPSYPKVLRATRNGASLSILATFLAPTNLLPSPFVSTGSSY